MSDTAVLVVDMMNTYQHPDAEELIFNVGKSVEPLADLIRRAGESDAVDVGTPDGPGAAVRRHIEKAGGIDALVTAAAAYSPRHFCDLDAATWDDTLNVALRGSVLAAVEASKYMRDHGGGRIVLFDQRAPVRA